MSEQDFSGHQEAMDVRELLLPGVYARRPSWSMQVRGSDIVVWDSNRREVFRIPKADIASGKYRTTFREWVTTLDGHVVSRT